MTNQYQVNIHGAAQGAVIGDNNTVTIVLPNGEKHTAPFLAPPPSRQTIVGREDITSWIKEPLLAERQSSTIALTGLPGVGKTALALSLAYDEDIIKHFSDGILWASLGQSANLMLVLDKWCQTMGLSSQEIAGLPEDERSLALHDAIGSKYILMIIDDVWSIEDALLFNIGGINCARVFTTRLPDVAAQITPQNRIQVNELNQASSLQLLSQLAPEAIAADETGARHLLETVGGLPLAVQLIGNYLRIQSTGGKRRIDAALQKLQDAGQRLSLAESVSPLEAHPSLSRRSAISLNIIIEISVRALTEEQQTAFYAMGTFLCKPMSFSEEAAMAVCDVSVDVLDALADTGLVEVTRQSRYMLHQAISEYCQLHIKEQKSYQLMINYYLNYLRDNVKDFKALDQEIQNILAAVDKAYELGDSKAVVQSTLDLHEYLGIRGLHLKAIYFFERARDIARQTGDEAGLSAVLFYLGHMKEKRGELDLAEEYLNESLSLARKLGNNFYACKSLNILGWVAGGRGDYKKSIAFFQEGLELCRVTDHENLESGFLHGLGWAASKNAAYDLAEKYLLESLSLERIKGIRESIGMTLNDLGAVLTLKRDFAGAEKYLFEGLDFARDLGHQEHIIQQLSALGDMENHRGRFEAAAFYLDEALEICDKTEISRLTNNLMSMCGRAATGRGKYTLALEYLMEGLRLARDAGRQEFEMAILVLLANLHMKTGQQDMSLEYVQRGLALAETVNHPENHVETLLLSARLQLEKRMFESAEQALDMADKIAAAIHRSDLSARIHILQARILDYKGQVADAERLCRESLHWAEENQAIEEQIFALEQLVQHEVMLGQWTQAEAQIHKGLALAETHDYLEWIAIFNFLQAKVAVNQDQTRNAKSFGKKSLELFIQLGHSSAVDVSGWLETIL